MYMYMCRQTPCFICIKNDNFLTCNYLYKSSKQIRNNLKKKRLIIKFLNYLVLVAFCNKIETKTRELYESVH